jgi:hypothetical protein
MCTKMHKRLHLLEHLRLTISRLQWQQKVLLIISGRKVGFSALWGSVMVDGRSSIVAAARFLNRARPIMTPFILHNSITLNSHCMHIMSSGIRSFGALPDLSNAHTGNYQVTLSTALFNIAPWTGHIFYTKMQP